MCGRLNVSDDPFVMKLIEDLGILNPREVVKFSRFKRATDTLSIIRNVNGQPRIDDATWWLLLDKTDIDFKPSKYTSFNTRYDKLNVPRSAGFTPFRETRCIIPAKGFGETEFINKKPVHYHDVEAIDGQAIAFGGLYRHWFHPQTGESRLSCSVITLPPHPKLENIHKKSMPLILPQDPNLLRAWIDPNFTNTEAFNFLMTPHIPQPLNVYPINKPSEYQPIGEPWQLAAD